jgi:FkbM family methyltransferase
MLDLILNRLSLLKRKVYNFLGIKYTDLDKLQIDLFANILFGNKLTVIDIGGAVNLQPHFNKLIGNSNFYIFEPDDRSYQDLLRNVNRYAFPNDFFYINKALSSKEEVRKLYLSNEPTGTSILPLDMESGYVDKDSSYFFPMKEISINTFSLQQVIDELRIENIDIIKIDVQGAELEILNGIDKEYLKKVNAIELEIGLHSIYLNQTTFSSVEEFMKNNGFGLYDFRSSRARLLDKENKNTFMNSYFGLAETDPSVSARLYELDAIYIREPKYAVQKEFDKERLLRLIIVFCTYNFFEEAVQVLNQAFKNDKITKNIYDIILKNIIQCNYINRRKTNKYLKSLKLNNYNNWGQYMDVTYPSN